MRDIEYVATRIRPAGHRIWTIVGKQNTIRSAAEHYLYTREPGFDALRFDLIGILADRPEVRVCRIEDAS